MSWLVKLGKANRSPQSSRERQFKSPKTSLSSLIHQFNQNQNKPLNFNCNDFRVRAHHQQQLPQEYNQFTEVLKVEREKKNRNTKAKKNIIFTQNNCFAKAVAEYRDQQKLKSTVKFQVPPVIHEADIEESIDIQETMKMRRKVQSYQDSGFYEGKMKQSNINEINEANSNLQISQNQIIQVENNHQTQPLDTRKVQITTQIQQVKEQIQSPRQLTPTRPARVTVLKCRVIHTPTRITYTNQNIISPKQKPLLDQTNIIRYVPREQTVVPIIKTQQIIQCTQTITTTTTTIIPAEYKIKINGVEAIN